MSQTLIEAASKADSLSGIIVAILATIFTFGKVGWDIYRDRKNNKKEENPSNNKTSSLDDIDSIEALTDTYIKIIRELRSEVDALKLDVLGLTELKRENEELKSEIEILKIENESLKEDNRKQKEKMQALSRRVDRLTKKGKK